MTALAVEPVELEECAGCGVELDLTVHDEGQCERENETREDWLERMKDIADDRAFEAYRERNL